MTEDERPLEESVESAGGEDEAVEEHDDSALLRGPDLLTPREGSQLAAAGDTRLIIWAGERYSGKTTLSAEIYERHRTARANTIFAGSETLLGFEERIHPSRVDSGRLTPRTARTESDPEERELLHLAVSGDGGIKNLLFADIPGELFRGMRDHELEPSDVPLLAQADKLAVLIDGAMIADHGLRSAAVSFARQFIFQLKTSDLPAQKMDVILLLTKLDLVLNADESALAYWDEREKVLLDALQQFSSNARAFRTAARGLQDPEAGIDDLTIWLLESPPEPAELEDADDGPPASRIQRIRRPRTEP